MYLQLHACSRLCSMVSAWACLFARSAISSVKFSSVLVCAGHLLLLSFVSLKSLSFILPIDLLFYAKRFGNRLHFFLFSYFVRILLYTVHWIRIICKQIKLNHRWVPNRFGEDLGIMTIEWFYTLRRFPEVKPHHRKHFNGGEGF